MQTIQATASQVRALKKGGSVSVATRLDTVPELGESFTLVGPRVQATGKVGAYIWEPSKGYVTLRLFPSS